MNNEKISEPDIASHDEDANEGLTISGTDDEAVSPMDEAPTPEPVVKEKKSKSGWIAAGLVVALVGWMGSGIIFPGEEEPKVVPARLQDNEVKLVKVEAISSTARKVTQYLVSEGQALPNRLTQVRAEAAGNVEKLEVTKGALVKKGDIIARLGTEDRAARQEQAQAELARRQRDFDAVQSLAKRGYATSSRLEETRAALASARAQIATVSESLGDTVIRAPFSGVLDDLTIEVGEFVSSGKEIGFIVDVNPLIVEIQVPQQSVSALKTGQEATIAFITGETRKGVIRYVASNAKPATRTFAAEIEVANPNRDIPAGISAQIRIPTSAADAHFVSPAVLSLGSDGTLGVKTVAQDDTVKFFPIEMVRAETKGIWIKGLPDTARIITIGQGFVSEEEKVDVSIGKANPQMEPETIAAQETAQTESSVADPETVAKAPEPPQPVINKPIITPVTKSQERVIPAPIEPAVANERQIEDMLAAIRTVQSGLKRLGYKPGPADGLMGGRTRDAIRDFQKSLDLDVNGLITFDLLDALAEALKDKG